MGTLFQSEIEKLLILSKMVFLHKKGLRGIARGSRFVWVIICVWAPLEKHLLPLWNGPDIYLSYLYFWEWFCDPKWFFNIFTLKHLTLIKILLLTKPVPSNPDTFNQNTDSKKQRIVLSNIQLLLPKNGTCQK